MESPPSPQQDRVEAAGSGWAWWGRWAAQRPAATAGWAEVTGPPTRVNRQTLQAGSHSGGDGV